MSTQLWGQRIWAIGTAARGDETGDPQWQWLVSPGTAEVGSVGSWKLLHIGSTAGVSSWPTGGTAGRPPARRSDVFEVQLAPSDKLQQVSLYTLGLQWVFQIKHDSADLSKCRKIALNQGRFDWKRTHHSPKLTKLYPCGSVMQSSPKTWHYIDIHQSVQLSRVIKFTWCVGLLLLGSVMLYIVHAGSPKQKEATLEWIPC